MTTTLPPGLAREPHAGSPTADAPPTRTRRPLPRWLRGSEADPGWVRPSLLGLLVATAALYLYGLSASGWANSFYSAAAQAGSQSWKALFFGSSDAGNSITVDKPPVSLWVMGLSARAFGVNSWAILAPQALMGVATVGLLYASVRRAFTPAAGLIAGVVLAVTPVATLMFRFNNPDALLVLLLVAAAYAIGRAVEQGRTRWLVLTGTLIGFAFLTKMLQALLVVPGFAVVYLLAGPRTVLRRLGQLLLGGLAMVAAAGWYIALVELMPASSRPYIGGSQHNSILELTLGYNGLGRLTGNETGSVGGAGGPGGGTGGRMWGATGIGRLFGGEVGSQVAWLIPAAVLLAAATLWFARRAPRTDRIRAQLLIWTGWLLITGLVFSFMQGIFHAYYTVALAPAIGGMVGIGAVILWRRRSEIMARGVLSVTMAVTAAWAYVLLERTPDWLPWLRVVVLVAGLLAAVALAMPAQARTVASVIAVVAVAAGLAGPLAYSLDTATAAKAGSIVSAGPAGAVGFGAGGPGGGGPGGRPGRLGGVTPPGFTGAAQQGTAQPGTAQQNGQPGGMAGAGGLLRGSTPGAEIVALLQQDSSSYTWVAAAVGSNSASGYQLATGHAVLPIGGFNGSDPSPTLAQFQNYVASGKIHYFVAGGAGMGGMRAAGGSRASSEIASWVAAHYTAKAVGTTTVYDLTQPAG
jgi:4-amino-4-deoxy-L-arabinose transferase-like glycosyltransferase